MTDWGPLLATAPLPPGTGAPPPRLPTAPGPPPAALPPAGDAGPSPASPPLTAAPAGLPGFATDRLRTTFAPRIGKTKPARMSAEAAQAALHTHLFFRFATITAARANMAGEPHSHVTRQLRTYNHLLG